MSDSSGPDLEHLLPLARTGDNDALGLLLEMYRSYLTLLARYQIGRRLQGKVDAADVVQETFLEAHRDFGQFRGTTEAPRPRHHRLPPDCSDRRASSRHRACDSAFPRRG
jgi:RNA polymerase sigma-70 factor (ECF subfamily)